ncbi:unnamed protein product [Arctogadus glacialis]
MPTEVETSSPPRQVPTRPSDTPRSRKRQREGDLLDYLERSDAAAAVASERLMMAKREDQSKLLQLLSKIVEKM